MVNKAEQPEEQPIDNPVNTTVDITEEFDGIDTPPEGTVDTTDQVTETTEATEEKTSTTEAPEVPVTETPSIPPAAEVPLANETIPNPQNDLERRMEEIEKQNSQYRQQQEQNELLQHKEQYRSQLEGAGYLPEQAEQLSESWALEARSKQDLQTQHKKAIEFLQGQANAAEHFARQYNLQLADLTELRKYDHPQTMEDAAKRMKSDRDKDAEIARLRAQLVPSQSFDDSQSTPAPSSNEDRLLERYNQGDRSPEATAAARRATGL